MERVKQHFEDEAAGFDELILKLVPYYDQMLDALVSSICRDTAEPIRVIDFGCGTGTVAKRIKERFPNAKVTCFDIAENMIAMAKGKLASFSDVRFVTGNFETMQFSDTVDVAVSSLALHHLVNDDDKKRFYGSVYRSLSPGGCFFNADVVLGASPVLQEMYLGKWKSYMERRVPKEEVERRWMVKYNAEDHPAPLHAQLGWLKEAGFTEVDVVWKYFNYAVYGGWKAE